MNRRRKIPWIAGSMCSKKRLRSSSPRRRHSFARASWYTRFTAVSSRFFGWWLMPKPGFFLQSDLGEDHGSACLRPGPSLLDGQGEMRVLLEGEELELHAGLTVPQNAQRYYEKAKEMARKASGAKEALIITKLLRAGKVAPKKPRPISFYRRRKPKWYERFRWFFSSDGFMVLGGRDSDTNEEIYTKYMERRDLVLHTDAPGAPLTVIKTEGEPVPERTLLEAAQFAVSYSSVWKGGLVAADCYMITGDQVSKTPESGEFLKKGAFVIRGERTYFKDTPLGLAIGISEGILVGGPVSAVKPKADPAVEIEPGELNADDLAKKIYRQFSDKVDDRAFLKSVASVDQLVQFLLRAIKEKGEFRLKLTMEIALALAARQNSPQFLQCFASIMPVQPATRADQHLFFAPGHKPGPKDPGSLKGDEDDA
jgi:hypothetical protein